MKRLDSNLFRSIFSAGVILGALTLPLAAQAESWHASVGAQSHDKALQAMAFLPNEMWIHAGDDITWKFVTDEIHTITFLKAGQVRPPFPVGCPGFSTNPATFDGATCVTTGPIAKPSTFTVIFSKAGNLKLVCLVHLNMTATVHVLELSEPLPHNQEFYDDQAKDEAERLLAEGERSGGDRDSLEGHHGHRSEDHVIAGAGELLGTPGGRENVVVMRFIQDKTVIHAGETVGWSNGDPSSPHTITFGVEPANLRPPSANVTVDTDGARHAVIQSTADNVHSGFIGPAPEERVGLNQTPVPFTRFRVTFTKAGIYPYICALHDDLGMKGEVIVLP
jgi:plastocyanin